MNRQRAAMVGGLVAAVALLGALPARAAPDYTLPAVELRIRLDRALAEHAFLVVETVRTGVAGSEEFAVADEALEENAREVIDLVDTAYGTEAADRFGEQWRNHIAYLIDYARAVAEGDRDAQELASAQLDRYVTEFSALLAEMNPGLPREIVTGLIEEHRQQLGQVAAFVAGDFAEGYPALRGTIAHMFSIGDGLAAAIVGQSPDAFLGAGSPSAWRSSCASRSIGCSGSTRTWPPSRCARA